MSDLTDHGPNPYVLNVEEATLENQNFRSTLWTGAHLQLTVMAIPVGETIGLEAHHGIDQFLRIEQGTGSVRMGPTEDEITFTAEVQADWVIFVPAGMWHDVANTGRQDLKLYTLYGPPDHVPGTVHPTKHDAEIDPNEH